MNIIFITVIISCLSYANCKAQTAVRGNIQLDSTYSKTIYLSRILILYDIYNSANHLIIDSTTIDAEGNWQLNIEPTKETALFRLQVRKKYDPVTSLVIGTEEENFGLIAVNNREIIIENHGNRLIPNFGVEDVLNRQLAQIDSVSKHWSALDDASKNQDEKISIRKVAAGELLKISDTSSSALPAIYAAHLANFGFNSREVESKMYTLSDKFGEHPYLLPYNLRPNEGFNPFLIVASILVSIFILWRFYKFYTKDRTKKTFDSLSYREKEVFKLVLEGRTNKEISQQLNIEPSTVKSHLKNIYSKLNVKSRNQLSQFRYIS